MRPVAHIATALLSIAALATFAFQTAQAHDADEVRAGWTAHAPREEIKPKFGVEAHGGKGGEGALTLAGDDQPGRTGWWQKTFPVEGGKHYITRRVSRSVSAILCRSTSNSRPTGG